MEAVKYEKIRKDIERVNYEIKNNIEIRKKFLSAQDALWDVIKKNKENRRDEMDEITDKIGYSTGQIDAAVSELKKYFVVHRAFDLAVSYLDLEIERCRGIINYTKFLIKSVNEGKCNLISSEGKIGTDCSGLEKYVCKKTKRLEWLTELREKLCFNCTGENRDDEVKDNCNEEAFMRVRFEGKTVHPREKLKELFHKGMEESHREMIKEKALRRANAFIIDFSSYKNEIEINSLDRNKIEKGFRNSKKIPNTLPIGYKGLNCVFVFKDWDDRSLRCIGANKTNSNGYAPIKLDLVNNGNVVVVSDTDKEEFQKSETLTKFTCDAILKYYDDFPAGRVNIHVVDSFKSKIYGTFTRVIKEASLKNKGKKIDIFNEYARFNDIKKYIEIKCNDMFDNCFLGQINDAYDLFRMKGNKSKLDLIVIRNISSSEFNDELLDELYRMMQPDSREHMCGIRFIICFDNKKINENGKGEYFKRFVESADQFLILKNKNDLFAYYQNNESGSRGNLSAYNIALPLMIDNSCSYEDLILNKCACVCEKIIEGGTNSILIEDVLKDYQSDPYDTVIKIPFGKDIAENIVSMDFDCGGGGNIGFMAYGSSGFGKSSLFNAIVINGCLKYSPNDLNFILLDYKSNSAVAPYCSLEKDVPHITMVAPNSKMVDGLTILKIINEEINARNILFNEIGKQTREKVDNLVAYNKVVDNDVNLKSKYLHLPRIVLLVDEAQEMLRDDGNYGDTAREIADVINIISSKGRSSGIHMGMFAQNSESSRTSLLSDAFINQIQRKLVFRLSESSINNSGFGSEFIEHSSEIENLERAEIFIKLDGGISKVRVAFADNVFNCCEKIIKKYPSFNRRTLNIGNLDQIGPLELPSRNSKEKYIDIIKQPIEKNGYIYICIGEDAYALSPTYLRFGNNGNNSTFLIGSSKLMANSLLINLFLGVKYGGYDYYIVSNLRERSNFNAIILDKGINERGVTNINEANTIVDKVYDLLQTRKKSNSKTKPVFMFINALDNLEFEDNNSYSIFGSSFDDNQNFADNVSMIDKLCSVVIEGSFYDIYPIIYLNSKEDGKINELIQSSNNVVIFNELKLSSISSSNILSSLNDVKKGMFSGSILSNMFEEVEECDEEAFAFINKQEGLKKIKPVIYQDKGAKRINYHSLKNMIMGDK